MRTRGDEIQFMDITWSTKNDVNYDSCTKGIRKNSEDKEDITTTPSTSTDRTCDTLYSNNGSLQKNMELRPYYIRSDLKFRV
jgi:hypothetical protein